MHLRPIWKGNLIRENALLIFEKSRHIRLPHVCFNASTPTRPHQRVFANASTPQRVSSNTSPCGAPTRLRQRVPTNASTPTRLSHNASPPTRPHQRVYTNASEPQRVPTNASTPTRLLQRVSSGACHVSPPTRQSAPTCDELARTRLISGFHANASALFGP